MAATTHPEEASAYAQASLHSQRETATTQEKLLHARVGENIDQTATEQRERLIDHPLETFEEILRSVTDDPNDVYSIFRGFVNSSVVPDPHGISKMEVGGKINNELACNVFRDEGNQALMSHTRPSVVMDFKDCSYFSSAALGHLISQNKAVNSLGGGLVIHDMHDQIYEVFKITKLNELIKIEEDENNARRAVFEPPLKS